MLAWSRKSISYAGLGDESDDDFAIAPSKKKQKTAKQDKTKKVEKNDTNSSRSIPSSIIKRHSSFDRQLQQALELSMQETSGSQGNESDNVSDFNVKDVEVDIEPQPSLPRLDKVDIEPQPSVPCLDKVEMPKLSQENPPIKPGKEIVISPKPLILVPVTAASSSFRSTVIDDSIEAIEMDTPPNQRESKARESAKRCKVSKNSCVIDEEDDNNRGGSDFVPDDDSSSEDEDDDFSPDDDDSDFDDGTKTSKKVAKGKMTKGPDKFTQKKTVLNPRIAAATSNTRKARKIPTTECITQKSNSNNVGNDSVVNTSRLESTPSSSSSPVVMTSAPTSLSSSLSAATTPAALQKSTKSSASPLLSPSTNPSSSLTSPNLISRQWKPPGRATGSNEFVSSVKSPTSGSLRLGLSRNQRVKKLHNSVKVL